jgi:hypothetical protein
MRRRALLAVGLSAALAGCGTGGGSSRSAPTTTTTASKPAAGLSDATVRELAATASRLRGLKLKRKLAIHRLDRRATGQLIRRLNARDTNAREQAAMDDAFHLLGILPKGRHLGGVLQKLLSGQVAGLYDPRTKQLYVVRSTGGAIPPSVIVHEATHALQDQWFDLRHGPFETHPHDGDRDEAAQALVEGDATDVQMRYLSQAGVAAALLESLTALGELAQTPSGKVPAFLNRELQFPYIAGQRFVTALREAGGEARVNRAFRHPPRTTAAILIPGRYLHGDPPAAHLAVPQPAAGLERELETTFGAEDLYGLTGSEELAGSWRAGVLVVDSSGRQRRLWLGLRSSRPGDVVRALRGVLPRTDRVSHVGDRVIVTGRMTVG